MEDQHMGDNYALIPMALSHVGSDNMKPMGT